MLNKYLEVLHESLLTSSGCEIKAACALIVLVESMGAAERDTITAAFKHGPLYDGDIPSKSGRDSLIKCGLITKVVVDGQEGYNACTYAGARAYRLIVAGA